MEISKFTKGWMIVAVIVILMVQLSACGTRSELDQVSRALGIDACSGSIMESTDSHGGFHGDGTTNIAISYEDDNILEQIESSEAWEPFPMDETVKALVYGIESEGGTKRIGPYLTKDATEPLMPEISDGYYIFIDRHTDKETDILERGSYNFTVGVYDTEANILYFGESDT